MIGESSGGGGGGGDGSGGEGEVVDTIMCPLTGKVDFHFQVFENAFQKLTGEETVNARRFLGGPGSSPPRCLSKCGRCTPCKPVHVTVPPGTPVTAEYYPEAWRCKCGNKLYMP
ncbi:hypothetical protein LguiA_011894 [Lonicera macranthoides]